MVAITQEHLTYVAGLIGVIAFIRSISTSIDNKIEKNNDYLEGMIDRKLDKQEYVNNMTNLEKYFSERNLNLNEKIEKLEKTVMNDMKEIKESLKEINNHFLNCKK
ncbi:hypothetical protein [Fusobacterium pseudoperiodonticum]|jgi:hypothetical protein|uniref:hypothetical protein n=1 Tax=Fusobacterium pseudoperiodonticum TaxID=2663009 RepID=UPI0028D31ABE|nr:hypothetical protein [Fusobacterium pseudoperiodonticum]